MTGEKSRKAKKGPGKTKKDSGFTLIEIIIAISILSFGLLAVATMQTSSLLGTTKSDSVTQGTTIAMDRMERLMSLPYNTWSGVYAPSPYTAANISEVNTFFTTFFPSDTLPTHASIEDMRFEVAQGPGDVAATCVQITVEVMSRDRNNWVELIGIKTDL